jgi:Fe-S-cluster containining protein
MSTGKQENVFPMPNPCQACRGCCKFEADDRYFATLFTDKDIAALKACDRHRDFFAPYRGSSNVFQINLVPSVVGLDIFVCPYLDEAVHLCSIYDIRPFDCRFWPFIFMHDVAKKKVLWACFEKRICDITKAQTDCQFDQQVKESFSAWSKKHVAERFLLEYPELVWDYEPATFIIKEMQ